MCLFLVTLPLLYAGLLPKVGYFALQGLILSLLVTLNADLLFGVKFEEADEVTAESSMNGSVLLVLLVLAAVSTIVFYLLAGCSDPGFVRTQVFTAQETELADEDLYSKNVHDLDHLVIAQGQLPPRGE